MDKKKISFSEFMSELKKSAENYFECKSISENYDDNAITLHMENVLNDFNEESANDNFDAGFEPWHINYVYLNQNTAIYSYKYLDSESA